VNPGAPTASLTVAIYNYAISPYDDWHAKAWTASLVLLIVVGLLNIASRVLTRSRLKGAR
jgi:phosphate transport system permease protein